MDTVAIEGAHRRVKGAAAENHQAWMIAASLFIALFFLWGGGYNTGPIFLAALLNAFGWSHARAGAIIGGLSLAIGVAAPVAGWLLDRYEARFVMGSGAVMAVLGLIGARTVSTHCCSLWCCSESG
jgi:MFS family permease